ncbi:MAG: hypothetical protein IOC35_10380 [Methylobacterium sp.]|jgi:hypothetical protein|nr:hypothetical protein [Methylobacterium sp.]
MDTTHNPLASGFVDPLAVTQWLVIAGRLAAAIERFRRKVLAWTLSITLDTAFSIKAVEGAPARYRKPEIFNTDPAQGSLLPNGIRRKTVRSRACHDRGCERDDAIHRPG